MKRAPFFIGYLIGYAIYALIVMLLWNWFASRYGIVEIEYLDAVFGLALLWLVWPSRRKNS